MHEKMSDKEVLEDLKVFSSSQILIGLLLEKKKENINSFCNRLSTINKDLCRDVKKAISQNLLKDYCEIKRLPYEILIEDIENIDNFNKIEYPVFPIESMPEILKDYALAISESIQVPVDMPSISLLAVIATCLQGKYKIEAKKDWYEQLSLYFTIVLPPSERKSAVIGLVTKPIAEYEKEENERLKPLIAKNETKRQKLENLKNVYISGKNNSDKIDIDNVLQQLSNLEEIKPLRIFCDDVTVEKMVSLMAENKGKLSILSAEGGIFDVMAGRYSEGKSNIEIFLKGFSGDTIKVDRIGRVSEEIEKPHLSMLLAIQPSVLKSVVNNYNFRGRGLVSRFLISTPKSYIGERKFDTIPIDETIKENYNSLIKRLLSLKENDKIIQLSLEARNIFEKFYYEIETELKWGFDGIMDFGGKIVGSTLRIAGLIQLVNNINSEYIVKETIEGAIKIARYFIQNEKNIFLTEELNERAESAKYILNYLAEKNIVVFTVRDIQRGVRRFQKASNVEYTLQELIERKYIFYNDKTKKYIVNPNFFD